MESSKLIALLIDAENVSPKYVKTIIDEVSMYGTPNIRRIYGDWTSEEMSGWKKALNEFSIQPVQQFRYTQGKNASDSALIIDAMDILYQKNVDGFCLVSSDSDFTRLAVRLRESRMLVIGMGESKTPAAFKVACDTFKYLDVLFGLRTHLEKLELETTAASLESESRTAKAAQKAPVRLKKVKSASPQPKAAPLPTPVYSEEKQSIEQQHNEELPLALATLNDITDKIKAIIRSNADENGYVLLSQVGVLLSQQVPGFSPRAYGFSKLQKLIYSTNAFETKYETFANGGKTLLVRNK
jgi:predicted nuclease of predicted toxin-antitoxin system